MSEIRIPQGLNTVLDDAWSAARGIPGFLSEAEARFLGMAAACAPEDGAVVEIGSFKGKSTVMLAKVAAHYGGSPVVAIDPHNFNNAELGDYRTAPGATSFDAFLANLGGAGVSDRVEVHRAYSSDIAAEWNRPIRFLWIDGDHSYAGAKADFDGFARHLVPGGIVAFHDALHEFAGPIRVFVEEVLRSDRFGASGFVHSIAWAQFRPEDGGRFRARRERLAGTAQRLIPYLKDERPLRGLSKIAYKLQRARVQRSPLSPDAWVRLLESAD